MRILRFTYTILAIIFAITGAAYADGSISGTVTDNLANPIIGLTVIAMDLEADEDIGFATTDANGDYIIEDLPPGSYLVEACTSLYYINTLYDNTTNFQEAQPVVVQESTTTTGIDFQLDPSGAITGTVLDAQGDPIADLEVLAENFDDEDALEVDAGTDASGFFVITGLPPGDYRVSTLAGESGLGYVDKFYDNTTDEASAQRVTITGTATTSGVDFTLGVGGSITGTVIDPQGDPVVDLEVWAQLTDEDQGICRATAETDENGDYTILGLASGSYRVGTGVEWSGIEIEYVDEFYNNTTSWDNATFVTVTVPDATTGIDFQLALGTSISGTVTGWDTNSQAYIAVDDAQVSIEYFNNAGGWGSGQTDADGAYEILRVAPGQYRVRVEKYPYIELYYPTAIDWSEAGPLTIDVGTPATGIDFQLDLGGSITGTILDANSLSPVTGADNTWVNATPTNGEPWGRGANEIGDDGSYIIAGLPAGVYKVSANADGYDEQFYEGQIDWMMATLVEVAVGQTAEGVDFLLDEEAGGVLIGQVVLSDETPVGDAEVNANSMEHMRWKNARTDSDGNFEITGVTPGNWSVQARPPWGEEYREVSASNEMDIAVADGATTTDIGMITLPGINLIGQVLMPDDTPVQNAPVNIETLDWSYFAHANTDSDGYFGKGGLTAGTYRVRVDLPWGTSGIVPPDPIEIEITDPEVVLDIGAIKYTTAAKHITGTVQRADESGVGDVEVNGWRRNAEGWAYTQTDENGQFSIDVSPGIWELMIHPSPQASDVDWIYMSHPKVVSFGNDPNEETKTVTFTIESAGSQITGAIVGPDGETLRLNSAWVDIRDDQGRGNGVSVTSGGDFSIFVSSGVYNVWIGVDQQTYPYWSSPTIEPFEVGESEIVDLGEITLTTKTSIIQGTVTRNSDDEPVSGVNIHSWQQHGGWANTTTDDDGNYQLAVTEGDWEIAADPPFDSSYISGQAPQRVSIEDEETVSGIDFVLVGADGTIIGSLYDSENNLLTEMHGGWAYAREDMDRHEPIAGAPVDNGQFELKVPYGTYYVGVHMPPNAGYTISDEEEVTVELGSDATVAITFAENDSTISGTFYTDAEKTTPATGLEGEVFVMQAMGGAWQGTRINSDGSYELDVSAGDWNLGYHIMSDGYINSPPPDNTTTIEEGQDISVDFVLVGTDATIEGFIYDPDGNPLPYAWAWAHSEGDDEEERIDGGSESSADGSFSISVPSGREYEVGAHAPGSWNYIQPEFQTVTPSSGATVEVELNFKRSDATISGNVYYTESGNNVGAANAWVNAWSDDGQHTGTDADSNGDYQLNVSSDTVWHVDAVYHVEEGSNFYESQEPTEVDLTSASATVDLEVVLSDKRLPDSTSTTFDPAVGWTHTLENGMRIEIPAGAIPATDTVAISITPVVDSLQKTHNDQPLGFGYGISIADEATGNPIVDTFNANVLMTFVYVDYDLEQEGLTEDDISPAYFSTTTNSWTKVESFTVDRDANSVTVQINHFSTWALTGGQGGDDGQAEAVALTIQKCKVKAGKTTGKDTVSFSGTFGSSLDNINSASEIVVGITSVTDMYSVYDETIDFDSSSIKKGKYKYKVKISGNDAGAIRALALDLNKQTFSLTAKNVNLTGLSSPVLLEITIGNYALSGQVAESVINGSKKSIPIRLMRTYSDTLTVKKKKAKAGRKSSTDSLSIKGSVAVELVDSTNLANEELVITWGSQTFTLPQGSMTVISGKKYKCKKVSATEGGQVSLKIDLDKCTFALTIKNASLDSISGTVTFGMSFADFDETKQVTLP